jgi:integrase
MGRRSRGDGSIYKRKSDGLYVAQYKGKYRYSKDKATAKARLLKLMTSAEESKPETSTTAAFMDRWLTFAEQNLKPATIKRYREAIEIYVKPNLGNTKLHKVDALTVQDMYGQMQRDGLSPATVNLVHCVLSSAFKRALKWDMLRHNVITNVEAPRIKRDEVEVFTPHEVQALLCAASQDRLEALWVLALCTGARANELLGLEPSHINLDAGTLDIKQTVQCDGQLGSPKSKNSIRKLQLPQTAIDALHKRKQGSSRFVFHNSRGNIIRYSTFVIYHWRPLTQRAGIQYRNFHTCRHYVASTLLGKGLPITAVARYLGNDDITLLRTYSHLIRGMEHMVPAAMDEALG